LILPATWVVLDLDPRTRDRSIQRMIRTAVGTSDRLAQFRRSAVQLYRTMLSDAADAGAFFAATYSQTIEGRPLAASALAFLGRLPPGADDEPITIEEMITTLSEPGPGESVEELPATIDLEVGQAVRIRGRTGVGMTGSDGSEPMVDVTRFFVPVPPWDPMLVMAFSTRILPVGEAFAELFDQLARTARWRSAQWQSERWQS